MGKQLYTWTFLLVIPLGLAATEPHMTVVANVLGGLSVSLIGLMLPMVFILVVVGSRGLGGEHLVAVVTPNF